MIEFCKANPGAVAGLLTIMGSVIGFLVLTVIGLIRGWWSNTSKNTGDLWEEINNLKDRQAALRATLPLDYVRKDELRELKDTWRDLAIELRDFMNSCRKGDCLAGHLQKIGENHGP